MPDYVKMLAPLIANGKCVLFLGNDAPLGFPKHAPPNRAELARALAEDLGISEDSSLATAARHYEVQFDRFPLNERVLAVIKNPKFRPTPLHLQIAGLDFQAILTTSQDELLEQALVMLEKRYGKALTDVDTPFIDETKTMVYKLMGCVSTPVSLVLTHEDQIMLTHKLPGYLNVLRYLFLTRTLLFVNFNLEDTEDTLFQTLFYEVRYNVDKTYRPSFAVWKGGTPATAQYWGKRGLTLIDRPAEEFLEALTKEIRQQKRAVTDQSHLLPITRLPYKFLDYYEATDHDIFYGRQLEALRFFRMVLSHRITVLFGASGTGKTSLLKAGVLQPLALEGYQSVYVRALDDPQLAIKAAVQEYFTAQGRPVQVSEAADLHTFFQTVLDPQERLVVVLDQFEEFFIRLPESVRARFWADVAPFRDGQMARREATAHPEVRFIFSLREDFFHRMDEARAFIPELFSDSYRLTDLSDDKASTVITEPAARARVTLAPDLVHELLTTLRENGTIHPPQLQIVCYKLFLTCVANLPELQAGKPLKLHKTTLTLADYQALGAAQGILQDYVRQEVNRLASTHPRVLVEALLKSLVTTQGTKDPLGWEALLTALREAELLSQDPDGKTVDTILAALVQQRLVRRFERGQETLFELAHDHLAKEIIQWVTPEELQAKLARELLRIGMEGWHSPARLLLAPEAYRLIYAERATLRELRPAELTLLLRSALGAGEGVAHWFVQARRAGVAVEAIALEGLRAEDYRARAAAVRAVAAMGTSFISALTPMLGDEYPQVRVAAIQTLETLQPTGEWRAHLKYECYIPAGSFIMGDDKSKEEDEKPAHELYLDAYYIARYPVTNADYQRYMAATNQPWEIPPGKADHPVVNITWYQAVNYTRWAGMRLLTEPEWEKAASWEDSSARTWFGKKAGKKRIYPWGDRFDKRNCNTEESGIGDTTPVGQYSPKGDSPYGVADMAGNVWEWTASLYEDYPYPLDGSREDPASDKTRVLRGGSWRNTEASARCAYRRNYAPGYAYSNLGFRGGVAGVSSHSLSLLDAGG